jgi:class 3 adenylate cyclase
MKTGAARRAAAQASTRAAPQRAVLPVASGLWAAQVLALGLVMVLALALALTTLIPGGVPVPEALRSADAAFEDTLEALWPAAWTAAQASKPAAPDVVVIALDPASLASEGRPLGQLAGPLAALLQSVVRAQPAAIGIDLDLSELAPDTDGAPALLRALAAIPSAGVPLVLALDLDRNGRPRWPADPWVAAAGGAAAFAPTLLPRDPDGRVRTVAPQLPVQGTESPGGFVTGFVAALARTRAPEALAAGEARLDLRQRGLPPVLPWWQLRSAPQADGVAKLAGRVVLIGAALPGLDERRVPLALGAGDAAGRVLPGVLLNARLVQDAIGGHLLQPLPGALVWLAALLALTAAWPSQPLLRLVALAGIGLSLVGLAALALAMGHVFAPTLPLVAACVAALARAALESAEARRLARERAVELRATRGARRARHAAGAPGAEGGPGPTAFHAAILAIDLRDFTRLAERLPPAGAHAMANEFFARVVPLLDRLGGSVDHFSGDGLIAYFPETDCPQGAVPAALAAAQEVHARVSRPGAGTQGTVPALRISMGLAAGTVVAAPVGAAQRRDIGLTGDAVNLAARLQALAARESWPLFADGACFTRPATAGWSDLGQRDVRGHQSIAVRAWSPLAEGA